MSLRRIERELREALRRAGRADLDERALAGVRFTDDGGTIYVHVMARPDWPAVPPGDALVLANADYPDLRTCGQWREFLEEARLYLHDELPRVVRWLEGR
jgi:Arc/MetJ family transcription regulator